MLPLPSAMSESTRGSALCLGLHLAARPAPCLCLAVQPTHSPRDAAMLAELGHLVWKRQEDTQVTETAAIHTATAQTLGVALWKYFLGAKGMGRWRKCCKHSFVTTI